MSPACHDVLFVQAALSHTHVSLAALKLLILLSRVFDTDDLTQLPQDAVRPIRRKQNRKRAAPLGQEDLFFNDR